MTHRPAMIKWSGEPLLAPFSWAERHDFLVPDDIFARVQSPLFLDRLFAVMARCPQHQFRLVTAFPGRFHDYVRAITNDKGEWLTWRVTAADVLNRLGRGHEAKGHGPVWPLSNVALADVKPVLH